MKKEEVALYLDEHPEFFNDFPELLQSIQTMEPPEVPVEAPPTLNLSERLLKRAQSDRDKMQNRLEWILKVTQSNDKIQENLFELEKVILTSRSLTDMLVRFRGEMIERFEIPGVQILLVQESECFVVDTLPAELDDIEGVRLVDSATICGWFGKRHQPLLQGQLEQPAELFRELCEEEIRSQALIPIIRCGEVAGVLCLGSRDPDQFYEGLRTDFLERTADKLGGAINNLLLMDFIQSNEVIDANTGFFNALYLNPALRLETDRSLRMVQPLALMKIAIDSTRQAVDNEETSQQDAAQGEIARILREITRDGDTLLHAGNGEFWVFLPGIQQESLQEFQDRVRSGLPEHGRIGTALFPGPGIASPGTLLQAVSDNFNLAQKNA